MKAEYKLMCYHEKVFSVYLEKQNSCVSFGLGVVFGCLVF